MTKTVREMQDERLRQMTPSEKLWVSQRLRDEAWKLKAAWLQSIHPEWSELEVQDAVRAIFRDART
jgi:hypothetical protein